MTIKQSSVTPHGNRWKLTCGECDYFYFTSSFETEDSARAILGDHYGIVHSDIVVCECENQSHFAEYTPVTHGCSSHIYMAVPATSYLTLAVFIDSEESI